ncbi:hypothetical protein [Nocardioides albus]|uniref:Glycosyltransferase RgtA/B/C/D-like domain-containing protein n=1 Tax=Nocardioides albus TaxID=1841 RepID=A0A7W5F8P9_9ACTN|nr:hypothetical protein [Nocardioides albus]MBB3089306.1 hypothetical protein [Nocardioides albus]
MEIPQPVSERRPRLVLITALAMIAAQLGFRAWAVFGSWFSFDDFVFMSQVQTDGIGADSLLNSYGGHLMPAGLFLTWLNHEVAGLDFDLTAVELVSGIALADLGALAFLVSAFGRRAGILPPLAIYLFTVLTLPASIWWAVGVNQTPLLVAIFWGGWTHLRYLRTRRLRWAVATMVITVVALAFQEKSLFVFWLYAFLPVAYFASGDVINRVKQVIRRYPTGVVLYGLVATGYLALYLSKGMTFSPTPTDDQPLYEVAKGMAGVSFTSGILGGPFTWDSEAEFWLAAPGPVPALAAGIVLVTTLWHICQVRTGSARALLLVAVPLAADIALVTTGRAVLGPYLALEYRYITELSAFAAIALALAVLPLRGADQVVSPARPSAFLDQPQRVLAATLAVVVLGTYSSYGYVRHWQEATNDEPRTYIEGVAATLEEANRSGEHLYVVDSQVPMFVMWAYNYPTNTVSHVFRDLVGETTFPSIRTDSIETFSEKGELGPLVIDAVRRQAPSTSTTCPYPAEDGSITVPLDGPVLGTGWWTRVSYRASADGPVTVTAGDEVYTWKVEEGLHSLFFVAGAERFDSIVLSGLSDDSAVCVIEAELGSPTVVEPPS